MGLHIPEHLLSHIETLADSAEIPAIGKKERVDSSKPNGEKQKRLSQKTQPEQTLSDDKPLTADTDPAATATLPDLKARKNKLGKGAQQEQSGTKKKTGKPKKGESKGTNRVCGNDNPTIEPPFTLHHRFTPPETRPIVT